MAAPALAAAAIPGALTGLYKTFTGIGQEKRGYDLLNKTKRPIYYRPDESVEALKLAQIEANNGGLPGQPIFENNISAAAATGLDTLTRTAGSSGDLLDGAIKLKANEMDAINDLNVAGANKQTQDIQNLQQQLGIQSGYADKEFSYNKDQPYQNAMATASAMIGAGGQNKFSGLDDIAGMGTSLLTAGLGEGASEVSRVAPVGANPINTIKAPYNPGTMGNMIFDPATKTWRIK